MTSPANWADDQTLQKVKNILIENCGIRAFADAAALFRRFDTNQNGFICENEFRAGVASAGAKLTNWELKYLMLAFDKDRDGKISLSEFVGELVFPQMNLRRQRIVNRAFQALQERCNGAVTPADLRASFDISTHPEVRAGRVQPYLIERELAVSFGDDVLPEGADSFSEESFRALFSGISSVVPSDDIFDELITLGFHIDGAGKPTFDETGRDWSASRNDAKDPLDYTPHRPDDAYSKALQATNRQKGYDQSVTRRPQPDREPKIPRTVPRTWETTSRVAYGKP